MLVDQIHCGAAAAVCTRAGRIRKSEERRSVIGLKRMIWRKGGLVCLPATMLAQQEIARNAGEGISLIPRDARRCVD